MPSVRVTSREFNQDTSRAKKAAESGPVFITDRGRTSHVLLSFADYEKITNAQQNIADLLAMSEGLDVEFDPPALQGPLSRSADFD